MNYQVTIKLMMESPNDAEQIAKRLRAILEFGTIREAIGDALDLPNDHHPIDVAVSPDSHANGL